MTVIFCETQQAVERYRLTLGQETKSVLSARELRDYLEANPIEQLVVIGPEIPLDVATGIAETYRGARPELGVVLVRSRVEVSGLSQAMRSGIREVVSGDDASALLEATKRSLAVSQNLGAQVLPQQSRRAKTILVFSAKGGCGKTTLATNLAEALAREKDKTVCIVDFDLQFGDVAVALQLEPTHTISDAIRMEANLDKQGLLSLLVQHQPNLWALLSPVDPSVVEFITASLAEKILVGLQSSFDYVVIDSPPAFTEVILKAFDLADDYLLLSTLDVPSLKNLKVTLGTLEALGMPRNKWHVVVNRSTAHSGLGLGDIEAAIGLPISATIPASDVVSVMINQGRTVVSGKPHHPVSRAVYAIADRVKHLNDSPVKPPRHQLFGRKHKH
jgi:pilus assembly protein CpaE